MDHTRTFSPEKTKTQQKGTILQHSLVPHHLLSFPRRAEGIDREGVFHVDVQTNSRQNLPPTHRHHPHPANLLRHTQRQRPAGVTKVAAEGTVAKGGLRTLWTLEPPINDERPSGG